MRINIYIENTNYNTEPKVCTEKDKLEVIQQMAQKIREDADWVMILFILVIIIVNCMKRCGLKKAERK